MITSGLASIEYKPQDQAQLHGAKKCCKKKIKKNYMILATKLYFKCWIGLYFEEKNSSVNAPFYVFALYHLFGNCEVFLSSSYNIQ